MARIEAPTFIREMAPIKYSERKFAEAMLRAKGMKLPPVTGKEARRIAVFTGVGILSLAACNLITNRDHSAPGYQDLQPTTTPVAIATATDELGILRSLLATEKAAGTAAMEQVTAAAGTQIAHGLETAAAAAVYTATPTNTEKPTATPTFVAPVTATELVKPSSTSTEKPEPTVAVVSTTRPPINNVEGMNGQSKDESFSLNASRLQLTNPLNFKENYADLLVIRGQYPESFDAQVPVIQVIADTPKGGIHFGIENPEVKPLVLSTLGLGFSTAEASQAVDAYNKSIEKDFVLFKDKTHPRLAIKDPNAYFGDLFVRSDANTARSIMFADGFDDVPTMLFAQYMGIIQSVNGTKNLNMSSGAMFSTAEQLVARTMNTWFKPLNGNQSLLTLPEGVLTPTPMKGIEVMRWQAKTCRVQDAPDTKGGDRNIQTPVAIEVKVVDQAGKTEYSTINARAQYDILMALDLSRLANATAQNIEDVIAAAVAPRLIIGDTHGYQNIPAGTKGYEVAPKNMWPNQLEEFVPVLCKPGSIARPDATPTGTPTQPGNKETPQVTPTPKKEITPTPQQITGTPRPSATPTMPIIITATQTRPVVTNTPRPTTEIPPTTRVPSPIPTNTHEFTPIPQVSPTPGHTPTQIPVGNEQVSFMTRDLVSYDSEGNKVFIAKVKVQVRA